jgi:type III secretion system export apparatus protein
VDQLILLSIKGFELVLKLSLPVIVGTIIVGFVIALVQAATQIQDQAMPVGFKLVFGIVIVLFCKGWYGNEMMAFSRELFSTVVSVK